MLLIVPAIASLLMTLLMVRFVLSKYIIAGVELGGVKE